MNMELSDEANSNPESSVLDCAIMISLNMLELNLYERQLEGKDTPITNRQADEISNGNWDKVITGPDRKTTLKYLGMIPDLERLQKSYENREYLLTQEFANQSRKGLRVIPYDYCRQVMAYLKGFYLHQSGHVNEAIGQYASALAMSGRHSNNRVRLMALESTELIIKEKIELERYQTEKENKKRGFARGKHVALSDTIAWNQCKSIYKFLSHHYILRRSVVFIVDTQFDSVVYRDKAMKTVKDLFKNLDGEDFFGYISLDDTKQASIDEIILQKKAANKKMKMRLMKDIAEREVGYVNNSSGHSNKAIRLERALELAYEW